MSTHSTSSPPLLAYFELRPASVRDGGGRVSMTVINSIQIIQVKADALAPGGGRGVLPG